MPDAEPREFDLFLIYFGDKEHYDFGVAEYRLRRKGFKFALLDWALEEYRSVIDQYDRIWCPDDDIQSSTKDINRLFQIFSDHNLLLAQPAIAKGQVTYQSLLQSKSTLLRITPFVEVMCPIFTRDVLLRCKSLFLESESGWGIDWVWSKWFAGERMAIVDEVGVHHTGILKAGELYQKLLVRGIDPVVECEELMAANGGIDRTIPKRMARGTMPMRRIPLTGRRDSWLERVGRSLRRAG